MNLAIFSLICLILTVLLGFKFRINVGLVSLTVALILCHIGGISESALIKGFNSGLFLMLLGVMFLFGIAQSNGTIELIAKKIISLAGKRTYLIPLVIYITSAIISAVGPGAAATLVLMSVFSISLAKEMKISPFLLATMGFFGTAAAGMSPISVNGIILDTAAHAAGEANVSFLVMANCLIIVTVVTLGIYFYYGGYKICVESPFKLKELPTFNAKQCITMGAIVLMVFCVWKFHSNVGMISLMIGTILLFFNIADQKQVLQTIGWNTIIMITGISVLISVVIQLGGVSLLANGLASIMVPATAPAIYSLTASVFSLFCSVSGVILPTLSAIIPDILVQLGGDMTYSDLVVPMAVGAHVGGLSPFTGGAIMLSAYETVMVSATAEEKQDFMQKLLKCTLVVIIGVALFGLSGYYMLAAKIFG